MFIDHKINKRKNKKDGLVNNLPVAIITIIKIKAVKTEFVIV